MSNIIQVLSVETITLPSGPTGATGPQGPTSSYPSPNISLYTAGYNPAAITSTSYVQLGLGFTFSCNGSGSVLICSTGIFRNSTGSDGGVVSLTYGTGTPPSNGAAQTGTQLGSSTVNYASFSGNNINTPWTISVMTTGLTPNTVYWFDIAATTQGGTLTVEVNGMELYELK